jgi:transposase, IS6 family
MLSNSFKWKHYEGEIILLNVRWYLKYPISYRNLKEMMAERGINGLWCKNNISAV